MIEQYIYIFKGDDTNWNNEKFLTVNVAGTVGIDLSTMTAEFVLGSYSVKNIALTNGSFNIDLNKVTTGGLAYGPICGTIRIYDSEGRVKTAANTIPFYVTNKVITAQNQTLAIDLPQGSPVSINLTVGGTVSYNDLTDKPSLNGIAIEGAKTPADYGLQPAGDYATQTQLEEVLDTKQDVISDLAQIRSNAELGSTAVQPSTLNTALATKQDTLNASQLTAVNSGVDSVKVAQIATNANNIASLQNSKQASLTSAQLAAVNSGVTASTVAQIQTNKEDIAALDAELEENREWQKPSDWMDIRSGAISNSIYLLVGHRADYSALDNLGFRIVLSENTHNFHVYIDNVLYQTYPSGTTVEISWSALALATGQRTNFPIDVTTHIVRITPENNSDTIYSYATKRANATSGEQVQGILWAHFAVDYALDRVRFVTYNDSYNYFLVAVTALADNLHIAGQSLEDLFGDTYDRNAYKSHYLTYVPTIEVDTVISWGGAFNNSGPLKKVKLKVNTTMKQGPSGNAAYGFTGNIEKVEINKPIILSNYPLAVRSFAGIKTKHLPAFDATDMVNGSDFVTNNENLRDTILDFSNAKQLTILGTHGSSSNRMNGLKGLFVSNEAPFNSATSPQLNVSYTGLDRAALVNLFKSMPTVSASQVCNITGATGAADLTAEDLAIAVNKGWTITR